MREKSVDIRTDELGFGIDSKIEGLLSSGAKDFSGFMDRNHSNGEGSFEAPQHADKRRLDRQAWPINFFHEVSNNLSIRVGKKEMISSLPQ
jgi:hypothetical protein